MENTMITKKHWSVRMISMVLSMIMILSGVFTTSLTANAAVATFDSSVSPYNVASMSVKYQTTNKTYQMSIGGTIWKFTVNGKVAFCVAPGGSLYSNTNLNQSDSGSNTYFDDLCNANSGLKRAIGLVCYYGYGGDEAVYTNKSNAMYAATQMLIWELIVRGRSATNFSELQDGKYVLRNRVSSSSYYDTVADYQSCYDAILAKCQNHTKVPSVSGSQYVPIPTYTMKYNPSSNTYTYTTAEDNTGNLSKYKWTSSNKDLKISQNGNRLVFTSSKVITSNVTVTGERKIADGATMHSKQQTVWGDWSNHISNSAFTAPQVLASDVPVDPVYAYIKVKTESVGNIEINKQWLNQTGSAVKYSGTARSKLKYLIKNTSNKYLTITGTTGNYTYNGTSNITNPDTAAKTSGYVMKLDNNDKIVVKNLPLGSYTIVEYKDDEYRETGYAAVGQNYVTLTVKAGSTVKGTVKNQPTVVEIAKVFDKYGNATHEDYQKIVLKIKNSSGSYIGFTSKGNGVYEYGGSTTQLTFVDKNTPIKLVGMPYKTGNKYTVEETSDGSTHLKHYTFQGQTFSVSETNTRVNAKKITVKNTENDYGEIKITKQLKFDNGTSITDLTDDIIRDDAKLKAALGLSLDSTVTLNTILNKLEFKVKNADTGEELKFYQTGSGSYVYSQNGTVSIIKLATNNRFAEVRGLPYGRYTVTEIGYGGLAPQTKSVTKTITYKDSTDNIVEFPFTNYYRVNSGLHVEKIFLDSDNDDAATTYVPSWMSSLLDSLQFYITDSDGNYVRAEKTSDGTYINPTYVTSKNTATIFKLKVKTVEDVSTYCFDVSGLAAGDYTVTEIIADNNPFRAMFTCKNGSAEDPYTQSYEFRLMDNNSSASLTFENIKKTSSLIIQKESEDNVLNRQFSITAYVVNSRGKKEYLKNSDGSDYKILVKTTAKSGKVKVENLPVQEFDSGYNMRVVHYVVAEEGTPIRYIIPEPVDVTLMKDNSESTGAPIVVPTCNFINKLRRGTLKVIKTKEVDEKGTIKTVPFEGVSFELSNNITDEKVVKTTNKNGEISFEDLIVETAMKDPETGTTNIVAYEYTVKELSTAVNEQYILSSSKTETFDYTDRELVPDIVMNFDNELKKGSVLLQKVDADTNEPITDAEFTLFTDKGCTKEYRKLEQQIADVYDDEESKIGEALTGIYSLDDISAGTYYLKETKTPNGYIEINKVTKIEITEDGQQIVLSMNRSTAEIALVDEFIAYSDSSESAISTATLYYNYPVKVDISVEKKDGKTKEKLSGAKFTLYKDTDGNGKLDTKVDEKVGTLKEYKDKNKEPYYAIENVTCGQYLMVETAAPKGYEIDEKVKVFTVDPADYKDVELFAANPKKNIGTFYDTEIKGSVYIKKFDDKTKETMEGAVFTIYKDADEDGKYVEGKDEEIGIIPVIPGKVGEYERDELSYGCYLVRETVTPPGYKDNKKVYAFSIVAQGDRFIVSDYDNYSTYESGVYNIPIVNDIEVFKYDVRNRSDLNGQTLKLFDSNNNEVASSNTDYNFGSVDAGKYTVRLKDGITIVGAYRFTETTSFKLDLTQIRTPLAGAEFTLYNSKGDAVGNAVSGNDGYAVFKEVRYGKYTIKETRAPENHKKYSGSISVNVQKDADEAEPYYFEMENEKEKGYFRIVKTSEDGVVDNITFVIEGTNDYEEAFRKEVVTQPGSNGVILDKATIGTYYVTEIKVAERYIQPVTKKVVVTSKNTQNNPAVVEFENVLVKGSVDTIKVDAEDPNARLSGAVFAVYSADGQTEIGKLDEDANDKGHYIYNDQLIYGDYILREVQAPEGYVLDETDYPFVIRTQDKVERVTTQFDNMIPNKKIRGGVDTLKLDSKHPDKKISGAELTVFDSNGNPVGIMEEKSEGYYILDGLVKGSYYVQETKAPPKYILDNTKYEFTVDKDGIIKRVGVEFRTADELITGIPNDMITGTVVVTKYDKDYPDNKLSGATFIVMKDNAAKTVVGELVEVEEGIYKLSGLKYGNYLLKETVAPEGFVLDTNEYSFKIRKNGAEVPVETEAGKGFLNKPIYGSIKVTKADAKTEEPLSGAVFAVYNDKGEEVQRGTSDDEGKIVFEKLRYGHYVIKELASPENYQMNDLEYPFEIIENAVELSKLIPNTPQVGRLKIQKISEDHKVENVKFHIYGEPIKGYKVSEYVTTDKDGFAYVDNLVVGRYTVEEVEVDDRYLPIGPKDVEIVADKVAVIEESSTIYEEESSLVDYEDVMVKAVVLDEVITEDQSEISTIEQSENEESEEEQSETEQETSEQETEKNFVLFENKLKKGYVKVTKVDKDYPDNKLTGAEFTIYLDKNGNGIYDKEDDTEIGKLTETKPGIYTSDELAYGEYLLKETKAPKYYLIDDNYYAFTIRVHEKVEEVSNVKAEVEELTEENKYFVNKHKDVDVYITKKDVSTGTLIPLCKIEILDENKNRIFEGTTDSKGEVWFKLQPGIYYYREYQAPPGYLIDTKPYKFEVKTDDTIVKCVMTNTRIPDTPKTGDNTNSDIAAIIFAALISACAVVLFRRRRRTA